MNFIFNPKAIIGIIISLCGLYWAFIDFQFQDFIQSLLEINYMYILLATVFLWGSVALRALRWRYLFTTEEAPKTISLYQAELIGYFGNNVLPLRFGEFLRAIIIGNKYQLSKTYVFGTIVLERLLDTILLLLLSILLIFIYPMDDFLKNNIVRGSLWMCLGLVFLFMIVYVIKNLQSKHRFIKSINEIINSLLSIKKKSIFPIFILSVLIWAIYLLDVYFLECAFELNLSFSQIIMILVLSSIALSIPSAPGMIGTYHAAVKYTIVDLFGFTPCIGNAFAIIMHAYSYILLTVLGSYYFFKDHFSDHVLQDITNLEKE